MSSRIKHFQVGARSACGQQGRGAALTTNWDEVSCGSCARWKDSPTVNREARVRADKGRGA